jgi:hypothetical protein
MEGVFSFKTQVYQKLEMRFPLYKHSFQFFFNIFYKRIFRTTFPFYKDSRNGKNTPLVLFLSLIFLGIPPRVMRVFVAILFNKTPLGYDQLLVQTIYIKIWSIWLYDHTSSQKASGNSKISLRMPLSIIYLAIYSYHISKITIQA